MEWVFSSQSYGIKPIQWEDFTTRMVVFVLGWTHQLVKLPFWKLGEVRKIIDWNVAFQKGICSLPGNLHSWWKLTLFVFFGPVNCTSLLIATWQHLIRFQHPNKPHDPMMDPIYYTTFYGILWCNIYGTSTYLQNQIFPAGRKFPSWVNSFPSDVAIVEDDWCQNETANMVSKFCTFQTVTIKRMLFSNSYVKDLRFTIEMLFLNSKGSHKCAWSVFLP